MLPILVLWILTVFSQCSAYFGPDISRLTAAVDNILSNNKFLSTEISNVKAFEQNLRRELQKLSPSNSHFDDQPDEEIGQIAFAKSPDLYLHRKFATDYIANPLSVQKLELISNKHFDDEIIDFDVFEFDDDVYLVVTFINSFAFYSKLLSDLQPLAVITNKNKLITAKLVIIEKEIYLLTINEDTNEERYISCYKLDTDSNQLEQSAKIKVNSRSKQLISFRVPLTGDTMVGVLGANELTLFIVELIENQFTLNFCDEIIISENSAVTVFSINGQLYVGVADGQQKNSHLWMYRNALEFVFYQSFDVENATQILYFQIGFQHFLLISDSLYRWEGKRFFLVQHLGKSVFQPMSILNFDIYGSDVILLPQAMVWSNNRFIHSKSAAKLVSALGIFSKWSTINSIDFSYIFTVFDHRLDVNKISLTRDLRHSIPDDLRNKISEIQNKLLEREKELEEISTFMEEEENRFKNIMINNYSDSCNLLNEKIDIIDKKILRLKNETLEPVILPHTLNGLEWIVVENDVRVDKTLYVKTINGINITSFFKDSVRKNGKSRIIGTKTFTRKSRLNGPVKVSTWNEKRIPDNYVITTLPQNINSVWKVTSNVTVNGELKIRHDINNVNILRDVLLLNETREQHIKGNVLFTNDVSVTEEMMLGGLINSFKLSDRAKEVMLANGNQNIEGKKTLKRLIVDGHVNVGMINGIDLRRIELEAVRIGRETTVTGHTVVRGSLRVDGMLNVKNLNGFKFPSDFVTIDNRQKVRINGLKRFKKQLTLDGSMRVDGLFAGVDLNDVFLTKGFQEICGQKTFLNIVASDVYLRNQIEGGGINIKGQFQVKQSINGVDLKEFYQNIIYKNTTSVLKFSNPVKFTKPQHWMGDVSISNLINGFNLEKDFVRRDKVNAIRGFKTFASPVTIDGQLRVTGTIANVNISHLEHNLVRISGQPVVITGTKTFIDGLKVRRLISEEDKDTTTILPIAQRRLMANKCLMKGDVFVRGFVNDRQFEEISNSRITLSTEQELNSSLSLDSSSIIQNLRGQGRFNKVDIDRLWSDVLWTNVDGRRQVVTGKKSFKGQVMTPAVFTRDGVNGIHLETVARRAIYIHQNRFIDRPLLPINDITVKGGNGLIVGGNLNHVNAHKLLNDAVMTSNLGSITIKGVKTFDDLVVKGSLWIHEHVNGIRVNEQLLTTNTKQYITGNFTFCNQVQASDVIVVEHLVNKINRQSEILKVKDVSVNSLWTGGDLNGIDVAKVWNDAAKPCDGKIITGVKTFSETLDIQGDVTITNDINGRDYVDNLRHIVTRDGNWTITASKEFRNDVTCEGGVNINSDLRLNGSMNDDPVVKDQVIRGKVVINGPFFVNGNITVSKSLIPAGGKLQVKGNVDAVKVNGLNLKQLFSDTLMTQGKQRVTGHKVLAGEILFAHAPPLEERWINFNGKVTFSGGLNVTKACSINVTTETL